jgi:hypothetical protein
MTRWLTLGLLVWSLLCVHAASAQDKPRRAVAAKRAHKPPPAKKHKEKTPVSPATAKSRPAAAPASPQPTAANPVATAEEEDVRKEGDTEVKTVQFGGLDIEGQLKNPQMLYFLNRLRAEFDRPKLPHRSFMPELKRSAKEKDF